MGNAAASIDRFRWLEAVLGDAIMSAQPVEQSWPSPTETTILVLARGPRVVLQEGGDRPAIARRATLAWRLREVAPWIPVPDVVAADPGAETPWLVTAFVDGASGRTMLSSRDDARRLGGLIGGLVGSLASVPIEELDAPAAWVSAVSLADAASGWLAAAPASSLGPDESRRLDGLIAGVPAALGGVDPAFAHGDLVPVNLIVGGGALLGLLDLEAARIAHPLFDLAWFRSTLRRHHADVADDAIEAAFDAAGITPDAGTLERLDLLAALRSLELAAPSSAAVGQADPGVLRLAM